MAYIPTISFLPRNAQLVESEAIPYELLVITVMIDVGEKLRNWGFAFF
jgi:hypothetical protein